MPARFIVVELDYLGETYKSAVPLLTGLRTYSTEAFMDQVCQAHARFRR